MRMLKCHLANNREGHFVTADEAMSAPGQVWSCASCGCRLVLHASSSGVPAWFEHDQRSVAQHVLMKCLSGPGSEGGGSSQKVMQHHQWAGCVGDNTLLVLCLVWWTLQRG